MFFFDSLIDQIIWVWCWKRKSWLE